MKHLILFLIPMSILIMINNTYVILKGFEKIGVKQRKIANGVLKVIFASPIISLIVILVVIKVYLKTDFINRLSHGWIVIQLWVSSTTFYVMFIIGRNIKRVITILSLTIMFFSVWAAVLLTPLNHYKEMIKGTGIAIANVEGVLMTAIIYLVTITLLKRLKDDMKEHTYDR